MSFDKKINEKIEQFKIEQEEKQCSVEIKLPENIEMSVRDVIVESVKFRNLLTMLNNGSIINYECTNHAIYGNPNHINYDLGNNNNNIEN